MDALALTEANAQVVGERDSQVDNSPEDRSPNHGENKFQKAISAWRSVYSRFDLLYPVELTPQISIFHP
jgi:hypothetical protein